MSEELNKKGWERSGETNEGGKQQSASCWHVYSFAYYLAAVVVCLLIKGNPIKALKSSLRRSTHTKNIPEWVQPWRGDRLWKGLKTLHFRPLPVSTGRASARRARGLGRRDHNMPPWRLHVGSGTGQSPACLRPPAAPSRCVLAACSPSAHMPTYTVFLSN